MFKKLLFFTIIVVNVIKSQASQDFSGEETDSSVRLKIITEEQLSDYPKDIISWHNKAQVFLKGYQNSKDGQILGKRKNICLLRIDTITSEEIVSHHIVQHIFISGIENLEDDSNNRLKEKKVTFYSEEINLYLKQLTLREAYKNSFSKIKEKSPFSLFPLEEEFLEEKVKEIHEIIKSLPSDITELLQAGNNYRDFLSAKYEFSFMKEFQEKMKKLSFRHSKEISSDEFLDIVQKSWPSIYEDEETQTFSSSGLEILNSLLEALYFHSEQSARFYIIDNFETLLSKLGLSSSSDSSGQKIIISFATLFDPCFLCQHYMNDIYNHFPGYNIEILVSGSRKYLSKDVKNFKVKKRMTNFSKSTFLPVSIEIGGKTSTRNEEQEKKEILFFRQQAF